MKSASVFLFSVLLSVAPRVAAQDEVAVSENDGEVAEAGTAYFEDMQGETKSAVPRVIRNLGVTEVLFLGLNQFYVIREDASHNAFFYAIDDARKKNKAISFRADPVSRRIVAVDGVKGATAARKPSNEHKISADDSAVDATTADKKKTKRNRKKVDPRKAGTTTGWID